MGSEIEHSTSRALKSDLASLSRRAPDGFVTPAVAAEALDTTRRAASRRLSRLADRGWLSRVRRGLYYVAPLEASAEDRVTAPDPWLLASRAFEPCYVAGWSAAEHWGLTEQLFRSTFVATTANIRSRRVTLLEAEFRLARVSEDRIGLAAKVWRGANRVSVSSRELTLADGLIDPGWLGGVRHLADILREYGQSKERDFAKVVDHLTHLGRGAALKRLGFLLEAFSPEEHDTISVALEGRTSGVVRLDPAIRHRGRMCSKWGLWVNTDVASE